jgi:hypothetical protein
MSPFQALNWALVGLTTLALLIAIIGGSVKLLGDGEDLEDRALRVCGVGMVKYIDTHGDPEFECKETR